MAKIDDQVLGVIGNIPGWGTVVVAIVTIVDAILEVAVSQMDLGDEVNCIRHDIGGIGFGNKMVPALAIDTERQLTGGPGAGGETLAVLSKAMQNCLPRQISNGVWNKGQFVWSAITESVYRHFGSTVYADSELAQRQAAMKAQGVVFANGKFSQSTAPIVAAAKTSAQNVTSGGFPLWGWGVAAGLTYLVFFRK